MTELRPFVVILVPALVACGRSPQAPPSAQRVEAEIRPRGNQPARYIQFPKLTRRPSASSYWR